MDVINEQTLSFVNGIQFLIEEDFENFKKNLYYIIETKTEVEIKTGDQVIVNYMDSLNSFVLISEGVEYRFILYYSIIAAIRGKDVKPINGYVLFKTVPMVFNTSLTIPDHLKQVIDVRYGIIEHAGKPNKYYTKEVNVDHDKGVDITAGDKVVFIMPLDMFAPELEAPIHKTLDRKYRYCQRTNIAGKIE